MKVSELKDLSFSHLSLNEKLDIKNIGRPTPILNITQEQPPCNGKSAFKRKFDNKIYSKYQWICGCEESNMFFCFMCLLFGGDDNWSKSGTNDLKHIHPRIRKHENTSRHKDNLVSFQLLGKSNIATCLSKSYADEIRKHNEIVKKNRHVLSKIIDILKVCGTCNLALGHDESQNHSEKSTFLELVDFLASNDCTFNVHIQEASVFKGTSETEQNEILQCMLAVCREHILQEIEKSLYLAVMAYDTTDVSTQMQTVIVLRYELNGKVSERFWGFANPDQDANGLSKCILEQISPILKNCPEKLIGQTYDGAALMQGHVEDVNVKIQDKYKNAHFLYSYAHQLNKILEQAVSSITSVRIFFANLNGLSAFFSESPDRMAALQHISDKRIPSASQTHWNFQPCRIAQCVYNNKYDILNCFESIVSGIPKKYNTETVTQAAGFIKWLEDETFLFWLAFFSKVMPHVNILSSQLQKFETDVVKIQQSIDSFEKAITGIRKSYLPSIADETEENKEPSIKRRRLHRRTFNTSARKVCDIINLEVRHRFSFKNHLCGATLFLKENYEGYKKRLPLKEIQTFCEAYPMIDKDILKIELGVFYSRKEITEQHSEDSKEINFSGCLQTLNFITSFGLDTAFQEIVKVLKILVTIPMTTSETERCFPTIKLIKTFLKSAKGEDRLTALAMLSVEKSMVKEIPNFNEKVIEKFTADETTRVDFHYKK